MNFRWTVDQIDLGRAVNIPQFGVVGFTTPKEKTKVIGIKLTDAFLSEYDLNLKDQGQSFAGPSAKPNYMQISKLSGVEKAQTQKCLNNTF